MQEAFAMTDAEAKAAPDASYVTQLKGGGRAYSVYVYRYGQRGAGGGLAWVVGRMSLSAVVCWARC